MANCLVGKLSISAFSIHQNLNGLGLTYWGRCGAGKARTTSTSIL